MTVEALEISVTPPSQQGVDRLLASLTELEARFKALNSNPVFATLQTQELAAATEAERLASKVANSAATIKVSYNGVAAGAKIALESVGKAMQDMHSVIEKGSAMSQILIAKDTAAYEKSMQAQLAARADAYAKQKAIEESRDVVLNQMRAKELAAVEKAEQEKLAAHAAALKRAEDLDIAFNASTLRRQLEMAQAAQRLRAAGGDPIAQFGTAATTANVTSLTAAYKEYTKEKRAAAAAEVEHKLSMESSLAKQEVTRISVDALTGQYGRLTRSSFVLANATGLTASAFSTTGLTIGAVVGSIALLTYSWAKDVLAQQAMQNALITTGNYAGATADSLNVLAHQSVVAGGSITSAKDAVTQLTASGKFTADSISKITEAAVAMEHGAGVSIEKTIKEFESLAVETTGNSLQATNAVTKAAIKLDDTYHFLTESVLEQIHALEREGHAKEASALATETLSNTMKDRAKQMEEYAGYVTTAWRKVHDQIADVIDVLGHWGEKESPQMQALAAAQDKLDLAGRNVVTSRAQVGPGAAQMRAAAEKAYADALGDVASAAAMVKGAQKAANDEGERTRAMSVANHAADELMLYDQKHKKDNLSELQLAMREYGNQLEAIAKVNPASPLLTAEAVAKGTAQRIAEYTKNNHAAINDLYRAEQNSIDGVLKQQEQQIAQLDKIAQLKYKIGQIGDIQLIQADTDKLINTALAKIEAAERSSAAASKFPNKTAIVAKNNEEIKKEQEAIEQARQMQVQRMADFEESLQVKVTKDHIAELKARGFNQEAAQLESEGSFKVYIEKLRNDLATLATNPKVGRLADGSTHFSDAAVDAANSSLVKLVKTAVEQSEAELKAFVDAGALKDLQTEFQTTFTQMEVSVTSLNEKAAAGGGLLDRMQLAQAADVARQRVIPQMELVIQKLKEMNSQDPGVKKAIAEDELALAKLKNTIDKTWTDTLKEVDTLGLEVFKSMFSKVSGSFKNEVKKMRDTFQNDFLEYLYKQLALPFVMNVIANVSGSMGMPGLASAAQSAMGGSSLFGDLSQGASLYQGTSNLAALTGFGQLGAGVSATGGVSTLASGATAFSDAAFTASTEAASAGLMSGITSAVAAIPGWGWALAGAALLASSMQGGETRAGGQYGYAFDGQTLFNNRRGSAVSGATAGVNFLEGPSGGEIDSANVKTAISDTVTGINDLLKGLGSNATLSAFQAGLESSGEGRGGVFAGGSLSSGATFGLSGKGDNYSGTLFDKAFSNSPDSAQALKDFSTELKQTTLQALQAATDIPKSIAAQLKGVDVKSLTDTAATKLLTTITTEITGVNQLRASLALLPAQFDNLKNLSFDAAAGLIQFSGDVQTLQSNLQGYYTNFYTEAERMAMQTKGVQKALADLGYTGITTKDQFKALASSLDLTNVADQKTYASLMKLQGAFATVADYATKTVTATVDVTKKQDLEIQILGLQGKADAALTATRQRELAAIDASLRPLQEYVYALQDEATAKDALTQAYSESSTYLQQTIDKYREFAKTLRQTARDLLIGNLTSLSPEQKYNAAKSTFDKTYSLAKSGDQTALGDLSKVSTDFLTISRDYFASSKGYTSDFETVQKALEAAAKTSDTQADIAQASLDQLKAMVKGILKLDTGITSVDEAVKSVKAALDKYLGAKAVADVTGAVAGYNPEGTPNAQLKSVADYSSKYGGDAYYLMNGINDYGAKFDSAKSLTGALNGQAPNAETSLGSHSLAYWANVQALYDAGQHPTAGQSVSETISSSNTGAVELLYETLLKRTADTEGLLYWAAKLQMGTSTLDAIRSEIASSAEASQIDGSHYNGLDFVPRDNYKVNAHYGEEIVSASTRQARDAAAKETNALLARICDELVAANIQRGAAAQMQADANEALLTEAEDTKRKLARAP